MNQNLHLIMSTYLSKLFDPFSKKRNQNNEWISSDRNFDNLYPFSIQALAGKHWTPLHIAEKAAIFLATGSNTRILDIGSGVGKFCLAAAYRNPNLFYYGIEQRENLVIQAKEVQEKLKIRNAWFIHGNFTQLDFNNYDHFYFFNPFYENLITKDKIDENIKCSERLFDYYNNHLYRQLKLKPVGTRLVTLNSNDEEVPPEYTLYNVEIEIQLKFWVKTSQ